jgi:ribonucleoside-diphosphate reductase alpha chain
VPDSVRDYLRTALEIEPEWHVRMQAVVQRWVDNAVSKTVNMRNDVTPDDVRSVFVLAWKLGCKGVTVYRDRSKPSQVLEAGESVEEELRKVSPPTRHKGRIIHKWVRIGRLEIPAASEDYAGGCPSCDI